MSDCVQMVFCKFVKYRMKFDKQILQLPGDSLLVKFTLELRLG